MRRNVTRWLELAGLWALAVPLPLYQLLADSGDFLVARGNAWPDTPLVVIGLVVVPPTLMIAGEYVVGRIAASRQALRARTRVEKKAHAVFIGVLVAVIAIQFLKEESNPASRLTTLAGIAIGVTAAVGMVRTRFVPTLALFLSPAALLVPLWFLAFSPVTSTAWPHNQSASYGKTRTVPVVFLVVDELSTASIMRPDGGIDRREFPNFARLADRTTWFRNATTVADGTIHAVPAILTGHLIPEDDRLPNAQSYPPSIFARLGPSWDYNVGPEPGTEMCVYDYCPATKDPWPERARQLVRDLATIMKRRLEPGPAPTNFFPVPETTAQRKETFRAWIDAIRGGRTLNLLHIEIPHAPYQYDAKGRRYSREDTLPGLVANDTWVNDPALVREGFRRYFIQTQFTDLLVGEMIDRLDRAGIWDKALILVTADHGVAFQAGKPRRMGRPETIGELGGIPMFFKAPGQKRGRVDDTFVRNTDLLPTVGDYLGAKWNLPGRSLRAPVGRRNVDMMVRFDEPVKMPLEFFTALRDRAIEDLRTMRSG